MLWQHCAKDGLTGAKNPKLGVAPTTPHILEPMEKFINRGVEIKLSS